MASILTIPTIRRARRVLPRHLVLNRNSHFARGLHGLWIPDHASSGGTILRELTGRHPSAVFTGGPAWVDTEMGKAIEGDGTDDWIDTGARLFPTAAGTNSTFACWIKSTTNGRTIMSQYVGGDGNRCVFTVGKPPSGGSNNVLNFWAAGSVPLIGVTSVVDGKWHLIGFSLKTGTDNFRLFLDGQVEDTGTKNELFSDADTEFFCFGSGSDLFAGEATGFAVWHRALADEEWGALYEEGLRGYPSLLEETLARKSYFIPAAGGPVTVTQDAVIAATATAYDATITVGAVTASQDAVIAAAAAAHDATITAGAVSTTQDATITAAAVAYDATITAPAPGDQVVTQDSVIAAAAAAHDAAITAGAVSTTQDAVITAAAASYDATITVTVTAVQDAVIAATSTAFDATITVGAVSVTQDSVIAATATAHNATITGGTVDTVRSFSFVTPSSPTIAFLTISAPDITFEEL